MTPPRAPLTLGELLQFKIDAIRQTNFTMFQLIRCLEGRVHVAGFFPQQRPQGEGPHGEQMLGQVGSLLFASAVDCQRRPCQRRPCAQTCAPLSVLLCILRSIPRWSVVHELLKTTKSLPVDSMIDIVYSIFDMTNSYVYMHGPCDSLVYMTSPHPHVLLTNSPPLHQLLPQTKANQHSRVSFASLAWVIRTRRYKCEG